MPNTVPDSQLEFDLGAGESATDVEIESPEPAESANSPEPAQTTDNSEPSDQKAHKEELDSVSENVQRRIAKLTAKMREAERREQAALEYARGVQSHAQHLQEQLARTDQVRVSERKARLDTQKTTLQAIIKKAREEGDIDTETEAQERLTDVLYEQRQLLSQAPVETQEPEDYQQQVSARQAQQQQAPRQQTPPQRKVSPRAEEWAEKNEWFGKDKTMTYAAWGIHATLVEEEGIDPESDEYYTELDNRLRQEFPHRFKEPASDTQKPPRSAPPVAPASRSSGVNNARRTVRLTPSQVTMAKKLGVPLEEYAKYVKE